jgi:hypothetical protein
LLERLHALEQLGDEGVAPRELGSQLLDGEGLRRLRECAGRKKGE